MKYEEDIVSIIVPRENRQGINITRKRFFYASLINSRRTLDKNGNEEYNYPLLLVTAIRPSVWPFLVRFSLELNYEPGSSKKILKYLSENNINILFCQYKKQRINLMLDLSQYKPFLELFSNDSLKEKLEDSRNQDFYNKVIEKKDDFRNQLEITDNIYNYNRVEEYQTFHAEYNENGQYHDTLFIEKEGVIRFAFDSNVIKKIQKEIYESSTEENKTYLTYYPLGKKVIIFTDHFKRYLLIQFINLDYDIKEIRIYHDESPGKLLKIIDKFEESNSNILYGSSYLARFKDEAQFRTIIELREENLKYILTNLFNSLKSNGIVYKVEPVSIDEDIDGIVSDSDKLSRLEKLIPIFTIKIQIKKKEGKLFLRRDIDKRKREITSDRLIYFKILTILAERKDWVNNRELYAESRGVNIAKVKDSDLKILNNDLSSIRKIFRLRLGEDYKRLIETKLGFTRLSTHEDNILVQ